MSVLIKGMEMPEGCSYCMFRHTSFMTGAPICTLINEAIPDGVNWDERLPECKMIEVPEPHGDLKEKIMTAVCDVCHWPYVYEDEETMKEEKCDCCPVEAVMEPMREPTGEEDYW